MSKTFADYFDKLTFAEQVAAAALLVGEAIPNNLTDPYKIITEMQLNMVKFALSKTDAFKTRLRYDDSFGDGICHCYACKHAKRLKEVLLDED